MARLSAYEAIRESLVAGYPIVAIETWEEDRALAALKGFANSIFKGKGELVLWDLQHGLASEADNLSQPCTAEEALEKISLSSKPGFYVFKDLNNSLESPSLQRRIKTIHQNFRGKNRFLFLTAAEFFIPPELRKDITLISYNLPSYSEIAQLFNEHILTVSKRGLNLEMTEDEKNQIITALKGFTSIEIKCVLNKAYWGDNIDVSSVINTLQDEKEQLARKEGVLEYVRVSENIEDVGGLENLKEWLNKRKKLFSSQAIEAGIRPPRGLLMMGISGCGKSLSVKAISALWQLPLFRLDMNKVYSGLYGTPEGTFHRAIKSIESVAPAILWIDEIEGGISSNTAKDGGTGAHIFSAFLTWMQEKSSDVFVAATANRIDLLPAEIIRKGRFDQVFFIDLPNDMEREQIFKVHLLKRKNKLDGFDIPLLSVATEFWNGAEIEHVVEAATVEAFYRGSRLTQDDLYTIIRETVPLSRTMSEQIKFIKNWASERATSASKKDDQ